MAVQKCPRCDSDRVRRGYRPTSLFKKLTFRYNLLCDECNWEFVGFAVPGTVPSKSRKRKTPQSAAQSELTDEKVENRIVNREIENRDVSPAAEVFKEEVKENKSTKRRVKVKKS
jgi:hypothetical protein